MQQAPPVARQLLWQPAPAQQQQPLQQLQQSPWGGQAAAAAPPLVPQQGFSQQLASTAVHSPGSLPHFGASPNQVLMHSPPAAQQQQASQVSRLHPADIPFFNRTLQSLQWPEQLPAAAAAAPLQPQQVHLAQQARQTAFTTFAGTQLPSDLPAVELPLAAEPRAGDPLMSPGLLSHWAADLMDDEMMQWMNNLDKNTEQRRG